MNGVEAKIWLEIFLMILATSVVTSILNNLLMMLVVRGPRVREEIFPLQPFPPLEEMEELEDITPLIFMNLQIPKYLLEHLRKNGITTISQLEDLMEDPKAKFPYGIGKQRQAIIKIAYGQYLEKQKGEKEQPNVT